jgi:hypothetical protein
VTSAAWLAQFAAEALAALQAREPDPIERAERAAWQAENKAADDKHKKGRA